MKRRSFLALAGILGAGGLARFFGLANLPFGEVRAEGFVRPPGTRDEKKFLSKCIRCRACANVCEAGCIKFFSLLESPGLAGTPFLLTREKSCNLCMNCTQICPTGALEPIERDIKEIAEKVRMGKAEVIRSNCLSYNGRVCGVCLDACPLKFEAIILKPFARPEVIEDVCIGCGRCEERCPQYPTAIIVRREEPYGA